MKTRTIAFVITALSLLVPPDLFAEKPVGWSARLLAYRQDKGPAYHVTQTRDERRLTIRYQYGKESHEPPDVVCVRNLKTGRLESCETFPAGGSRRYQFTEKEVKVTLSGGRVSTHSLATVAHPQLLDAICAFVAGGRDSQKVLYISQAESFSTQGFVISREGRQTVTTPAGTFDCSKVRLALDIPMGGLFFRLDFLVAQDGHYPYIVKGRTTSGGDFQLTRID